MRIPINNDSDLKAAVDLVDKNDKITSLRVFLTLPSPGNNYKTHSGQGAGPSNTYPDSSYGSQAHSTRDSPSPPPGSLPSNFNHSLSCSSIHSEGEFIPEDDARDVSS
ncbi:hypothetical protein FSP39_016002 [Pinctada imbricata]|uniref:Uncharacterized protein n=1 Tax=Pinctada imbricata TaxID=66713 RepID=A0AA88XDB7_PINIB|nr:hypothetical protein FSP39_016002 [Pinctada imbricata]